MISYYSAVFVTALLLLGLLQYAFRKESSHQKILVMKVVGLTTAIAFLLPTFLNSLTVLQTGFLMIALAALGGALVPVAELLPEKMRAFENEGVKVKEAVTTEGEVPVEDLSEDLPVEEITEPDEGLSGTVLNEDATGHEEDESEENESLKGESVEIEYNEVLSEEVMSEEVESEKIEIIDNEALGEESTAEGVVTEEIACDAVLVDSLENSTDDTQEDRVAEEVSGSIVLPDIFSETMAEVMLMNGYLALKEEEEEEAIDSFMMVCQRSELTDQRMMAYMELKLLLPEEGRMMELIHLSDGLLDGKIELTALQEGYIEKHNHYLKRLVSLLNAHGVTLDQPYSAMPDELKEMAMNYQK